LIGKGIGNGEGVIKKGGPSKVFIQRNSLMLGVKGSFMGTPDCPTGGFGGGNVRKENRLDILTTVFLSAKGSWGGDSKGVMSIKGGYY